MFSFVDFQKNPTQIFGDNSVLNELERGTDNSNQTLTNNPIHGFSEIKILKI